MPQRKYSRKRDLQFNAKHNPKHAAGMKKQPFRHIPPSSLTQLGTVMALGADKYGAFNFSESGVVASVYYDAILRHLFDWYTTGKPDPESEQSHLAHIMACCSIVIECQTKGNLHDDRPIGVAAPVSFAPAKTPAPPRRRERKKGAA